MNRTQISIIGTVLDGLRVGLLWAHYHPLTRSFFPTSDLHLAGLLRCVVNSQGFKVIDDVKLTYASMKSVALKLHSKRDYECNQSAYLHSGAHQVFLQFWQLMARPVTYN